MNVQKVNIFDDCVNQIQHLKRVYLDEVEAKERLADANQKLQLKCEIVKNENEAKQNVIKELKDEIKIGVLF